MLIKFIFVLIAATILVLLALSDSPDIGEVRFAIAGLSYTTNLPTFALFLLGIFMSSYITLKIVKLPRILAALFQRHKKKRAQAALLDALKSMLQGNINDARLYFLKAATLPGMAQPAYLLAAYCSLRANRHDMARRELQMAREADAEEPYAPSFAHARLLMQTGAYEAANGFLVKLRHEMPDNTEVSALSVQLALKSKDYNALLALLPGLSRRLPFPANEVRDLIEKIARLLIPHAIRQHDTQMLHNVWRSLPYEWRDELLPLYTEALDALGETANAEKLLGRAIDTKQNELLLVAFGRLENGDLNRRLEQAQKWKERSSDPYASSLAIGMIYRRLKMFDRALEHLTACYKTKPSEITAHEIALAQNARTNHHAQRTH